MVLLLLLLLKLKYVEICGGIMLRLSSLSVVRFLFLIHLFMLLSVLGNDAKD